MDEPVAVWTEWADDDRPVQYIAGQKAVDTMADEEIILFKESVKEQRKEDFIARVVFDWIMQ